MKNLIKFNLLFFAFIAISLVSCQKTDPVTPVNTNPSSQCKIVSLSYPYIGSVYKHLFYYDSQGRRVKQTHQRDSTINSVVTFVYTGDTVKVHTVQSSKIIDEMAILNQVGHPTTLYTVTQTISSGAIQRDTATFQYNSSNYLIKKATHDNIREYSYTNGNRTLITDKNLNGVEISHFDIDYFLDKDNKFQDETYFQYGKPNKNLLKSQIKSGTSSSSSTYSYSEFNTQGYPTKYNNTISLFGFNFTAQYDCN